MLAYNTSTRNIRYNNDTEFRNCLRVVFNMVHKLDIDPDYDDITHDETDYDFEATTKAMDFIFEQTKDNKQFQILYDLAAAKMISVDRTIGLAVMFSYDNLKVFHCCLCDFIENKEIFDENTDSYKAAYNTIK